MGVFDSVPFVLRKEFVRARLNCLMTNRSLRRGNGNSAM